MSLDPDAALAAAVVGCLIADPSLAALIGPRAYTEPPRSPTFPYAAVSRIETRPFGGDGPAASEHVVTLTFVSRFGGPEEARAMTAAARAALHEAALILVDHRLVSLRATYADVFKAADWRFDYGVLRLRAVTEPQ